MSMYLGPVGGPLIRLTKRGAQDGVAFETIGSTSQSINGTTTQNIRARKRRWVIPTRALTQTEFAYLQALMVGRAPVLSLYDDTMANLLHHTRREMQNWVLSTGGAALGVGGGAVNPLTGMQIQVPASVTATPYSFLGPPITNLIPVTTGVTYVIGAQAQHNAAVSQTVTMGLRYYNVAGAFLTFSGGLSPTIPANTPRARYSTTSTAPAQAVYAQPYVAAGSVINGTSTFFSDVTVIPGTLDLGGSWRNVTLSALAENHPTPRVRFATVTLAEV